MSKIQFANPTVLLMEHGSTSFSAPGDDDRIHGTKFDLPLTARGRQEVQKSADLLADFDIASLEHSPMRRARESAAIISDAIGVSAIPNDALKPWDSGFASGMTHGSSADLIEYYIRHPEKTIPDGQPYGEWFDTYSDALTKKMKEAEGTPGQAHVLGVHSSEVSTAPAVLRGDPAEMLDEPVPGPGQIAMLEKRGGKWRFVEKFKGRM